MDTFITPKNNDLSNHQELALRWLLRSCQANQGGGSSAFYARWRNWRKGWSDPYPETTGYLIPTLFAYQARFPALEPAEAARSCYRWLLSLAQPTGAFTSLYASSGQPSLFNTGQILLGLTAGYQDQPSPAAEVIINRSIDWCLKAIADSPKNIPGLYFPGFLAAYYIRAVWPLALAMQVMGRSEEWNQLHPISELLAERIQPDGALVEAGFKPGSAAFLHTIAYTIRGWWELGCLWEDPKTQNRGLQILEHYWRRRNIAGRWAGAYLTPGKDQLQFTCLPGQAQIAILLQKIGKAKGIDGYQVEAHRLIKELCAHQKKGWNRLKRHWCLGSSPFFDARIIP
ncbi:MAG: hypothetical protein AAFU60_02575 [Bacteroidota bacterium]